MIRQRLLLIRVRMSANMITAGCMMRAIRMERFQEHRARSGGLIHTTTGQTGTMLLLILPKQVLLLHVTATVGSTTAVLNDMWAVCSMLWKRRRHTMLCRIVTLVVLKMWIPL